MKQGLIVMVVAVVMMITWWQVTAGPAPADVRTEIERYQFSADADEEVISLRSWGGLAMNHDVTYTLYGDGRLVHRSKGAKRPKTVRLSFVEMDDIVGAAVHGGLVGLDWETLKAEIRKLHPGVAGLTDTPRMKLEISLTGAQDKEGEELGPISSTFSCVCSPAYIALKQEGVPEVEALVAVTRSLYAPFDRRKADR